MRFHSLAEIAAENEAAQARFTAAWEGLSEAQLSFRPAAERWTIRENVEHVAIVNDGFLRILNKLLKQAEEAGKPARTTIDLPRMLRDENGQQPPPFIAPERVRPTGTMEPPQALAKMREVLAGIAALHPRIEATDLSEEMFPHPAFGPINAYQWMILLGEHMDRHRAQIEQIKTSTGYPA